MEKLKNGYKYRKNKELIIKKYKKMQKCLLNSKKSSNFARFFVYSGVEYGVEIHVWWWK